MIAFGPLLTRVSEPTPLADSHLLNTGVIVEIATSERAIKIPIYRDTEYWRKEQPAFEDYYITESDLPFEISVWGYQQKASSIGNLIRLSAFVCALYKEFPVLRSLTDFLSEFQTLQAFDVCTSKDEEEAGVLSKELSSEGYMVGSIWGYGRRLWVVICWEPSKKQAHENAKFRLRCGTFEFRPTPEKKLDLGKWGKPDPHTLAELLWNRLRNLAGKTPLQSLSEDGKDIVLSKFHWSRLSLMTAKQAQSARLDFIRNHPELWENPSDLAHALRGAGLYSSDTGLTQIVKSIPRFLTLVKS